MNLWRRSPSGRIAATSLVRLASSGSAHLIADDFFEAAQGIVTLAGTSAVNSAGSGTFTTKRGIAGQPLAQSSLSATASAMRAIIGVSYSALGDSGTFSALRPIGGESAGASWAGAAGSVIHALMGQVDAQAAVEGLAWIAQGLSGGSNGASASSGAADAWREIGGMAAAASAAEAQASALLRLAGMGIGVSDATGLIYALRGIAGSAQTVLSIDSSLIVWQSGGLAGSSASTSQASAVLSMCIRLAGALGSAGDAWATLWKKKKATGGTKMSAEEHKLAHIMGDDELPVLLVKAGLNCPSIIRKASDGDIVKAVGSENLAAVRAVFPARQ